jgi:hypothetical protein
MRHGMADPLHIELEIHVHGDQVHGSASRDGDVTTFNGWIELLAALDALIAAPSGVQS